MLGCQTYTADGSAQRQQVQSQDPTVTRLAIYFIFNLKCVLKQTFKKKETL